MQDTINQNDYVVERVVNVFHDVNLVWTREKPRPRQYDAAIIFLDGAIEYYFTDRDVTSRAAIATGNMSSGSRAASRRWQAAVQWPLPRRTATPTGWSS